MSHLDPQRPITIRASKRWLTFFATVILAPWALLLTITAPDLLARAFSGLADRKAKNLFEVPSNRGPWGDLNVVRIMTEPPEESLANYLTYPQPVWYFRGYTTNQYRELLDAAGLAPEQKAALLRCTRWGAPGEGCAATPDSAFTRDLSSEARAVLYIALSPFPENVYQHEPFRFRADLADEWFVNSGVDAQTEQQVRRLIYRRGSTLLFSDPHLVLPSLPSALDQVRLLKALARQSTLLVKLRVSPESDIASLVNYWAPQRGRAKDIRPLLESAARIPGGLDIDVTHLLPRFARKRIYTYPSAEGDSSEVLFDCHWNAFNFWNDPPDDRFGDSAFVIQTIETEYEQILDAFRFGDIVLFMKSDTQAIHSAVYIADDIVFTKNGPSMHSPWILMQLKTLISHYATTSDLTVRGYRRKAGAE